MRTLVLGLGNELAADDAVGVLVARAVRQRVADAAEVVESSASGMVLLEIFAGYDRAIVVDSIRTGRNPPARSPSSGSRMSAGWSRRACITPACPRWPPWLSGSGSGSPRRPRCSPLRCSIRTRSAVPSARPSRARSTNSPGGCVLVSNGGRSIRRACLHPSINATRRDCLR